MASETAAVEQHPDTPTRFYMDDPNIEWRTTKPSYDLVNKMYLAERTRFHAPDSMEKFVENLVKTWEMESTHKINEKVSSVTLTTYPSKLLILTNRIGELLIWRATSSKRMESRQRRWQTT